MKQVQKRKAALTRRRPDGGPPTVPQVHHGRGPKGNRATLVSWRPGWRPWLVIGLAATLVFFGSSCSSAQVTGPGNAQADEIHLGWPGDPRTSVAIDWHTEGDAPSNVAVEISGQWRRIEGHPPSPAPVGSGAYHEALISGLRPATTYQYAVGGADGFSTAHSFTTAPDGPASFRFDAFADQGACKYNPAACRVIAGIAADRPAFVLGAGDLSYTNEHGPTTTDLWLNDVAAYTPEAPLMPTVGNHEFPAGDPTGKYKDPISNYKGRFALPDANGEDYYSFDYANTHIVALPEVYVNLGEGSRFRTWLEADLAAARADSRIHWIVAFGHRPFYSTGQRHGAYIPFARDELPLLERYHVDLVINGHEHQYERSLPLQGGKVVSHDLRKYVQGQGIIFVVTGGGGANVYNDFGPPAPWDAVRAVKHEHLQINVSGRRLSVNTISDFGKKLDAFTIRRP
jgi:hypothetical protein